MAEKNNSKNKKVIVGTAEADSITNYGSKVTIEAGDDYIYNYGAKVSIDAGAGTIPFTLTAKSS